ncbi:uncharacterized protein LOC115759251 [Drosophila novamexicana]|uniref:uncharacterized protein LOC115759251 n=1 Tax=Drosophila novamexicana TaxID=47314 RepID=UPI0011E5FAF5|nr:uncharacterized protein LOC115759251 [Drosophila novamexicana]
MSQQLDINCDSLIEIAPSEWNILLNLYAKKKSESSGYPLISNYIKWKAKEPDLDIQCLSLNGDWQADGTFLMIVGNRTQRKMVFFNTLSESLERLTKALLCLPSGVVEYLLHDYGQRLVPAVDAYIRKCANRQLQTTQTAWYKASKELVATFSTEYDFKSHKLTIVSIDVSMLLGQLLESSCAA